MKMNHTMSQNDIGTPCSKVRPLSRSLRAPDLPAPHLPGVTRTAMSVGAEDAPAVLMRSGGRALAGRGAPFEREPRRATVSAWAVAAAAGSVGAVALISRRLTSTPVSGP